MSLVTDTNFTNNLTSVAAFSPFPTGGGNKVLKLNNAGGGVLLGNAGPVSTLSDGNMIADALIDAVAGAGVGTFGFIFNRDVSGKFYYLSMRPTGSGTASFSISRYSGGGGGSFTTLSTTGDLINIYTVSTIFTMEGIVRSSPNGPNLALLINDQVVVSVIDDNAAKSDSGQPGVAGNILSGDNTSLGRYFDNWFVRQVG